MNKKPGWWNHYIGASKAIDTEKFFIICLGNLGACHGITAAHATNPKKMGPDFPPINVDYWIDFKNLPMEHLSIDCCAAVKIKGGSLETGQAMHYPILILEEML